MRVTWLPLCVLLCIPALQAGEKLPAAASLTGLPGAFVGVSVTSVSQRTPMPSTSQLIQEIAAQLRNAGVHPMLGADELLQTPGMPGLTVHLDQWHSAGQPLGWVCRAELHENAALERDPARVSRIVVWNSPPAVAVTPGGAFDPKARELVTSQVRYFIQAYKAANPPK